MKTNKLSQHSVQYVTVDVEHVGQRLDNFLRTRCKDLPKSHLYRIIRKGEVRVNKKRADPDTRLSLGDIIRIPPLKLTVTTTAIPKTQQIKALEQQILYEDAGLLVVNKPSGLAVHGGSGISLGVIETLRAARPQQKYLELVHRLDRDTSGCLLIAKKASVLRELHELLRTGKVTKTYLMLVQGAWPVHIKDIKAALQKNQLQSGERMVNVHEEGKESHTRFKILEKFSQATLVQAQPLTGRTHQIRVHAQYAGHPIVGDEKYGQKDVNKLFKAYGCYRLFLHAQSLNFTLPLTGQPVQVTAELPNDLQKCLTILRKTSH